MSHDSTDSAELLPKNDHNFSFLLQKRNTCGIIFPAIFTTVVRLNFIVISPITLRKSEESILEIWIIFIILYGILKGSREPIKKNLLKNVNVLTSLFAYTFIGFLMSVPTASGVFHVPLSTFGWILVKSGSIFFAWILSFTVLKKIPVSIYGITDMSRVIFSTLMGVVFLHETMKYNQVIGLILVAVGLLILPIPNVIAAKKQDNTGQAELLKPIIVFIAIFSCILNAVSSTLDKYLMGTDMTSGQLQFWYTFFMALYYGIYILIKKIKVDWKGLIKNHWIWIMSILFVLADRALFIANAHPDSRLTMMTLIKQAGCLVTIIGGKLVFKEKNIMYKLVCAGIIIVGIVITVIV